MIKISNERFNPETHEEGSISPLIIMYFTIAMLLVFLIANVTSVYVAKRELINATEAALARATQELDEFAYYYQIPVNAVIGQRAQTVPLNCSDAGKTFDQELRNNLEVGVSRNESQPTSLNRFNYEIVSFGCDGATLSAIVREEHRLPFAIELFGIDSYVNTIQVKVQARYK